MKCLKIFFAIKMIFMIIILMSFINCTKDQLEKMEETNTFDSGYESSGESPNNYENSNDRTGSENTNAGNDGSNNIESDDALSDLQCRRFNNEVNQYTQDSLFSGMICKQPPFCDCVVRKSSDSNLSPYGVVHQSVTCGTNNERSLFVNGDNNYLHQFPWQIEAPYACNTYTDENYKILNDAVKSFPFCNDYSVRHVISWKSVSAPHCYGNDGVSHCTVYTCIAEYKLRQNNATYCIDQDLNSVCD